MIAFLRGTLVHIEENRTEIDTGSVGYEVYMPLTDIGRLRMNEDVLIYTHEYIKEDEQTLYGFLSRDERTFFRQLINVSGIGPKGALQILGAFTLSELRMAILAGDSKTLSKAPGVGAKTAQRLVIELKDKVHMDDIFDVGGEDIFTPSGEVETGSARSEAVMALTALGYSNSDALKAVRPIDTKDMTVEEILRAALKNLGR